MLSLSEKEGYRVLTACTKSQSTPHSYKSYWSTHSGALINLKDPSETGNIVLVKKKFTDTSMSEIKTTPWYKSVTARMHKCTVDSTSLSTKEMGGGGVDAGDPTVEPLDLELQI